MPCDTVLVGPFQGRLAGELSPVVTDDTGGFAIDANQGIEFLCHSSPRDAGVREQGKVLAATIVVHGQYAEHAASPPRKPSLRLRTRLGLHLARVRPN